MPPEGSGSLQEALSSEYLAQTALYRIKVSLKAVYEDRENYHFPNGLVLDMDEQMVAIGRRLRALEYQFRVKGWPLPDYELWKHPPVPADWDEKHPHVEIEYAKPVAQNIRLPKSKKGKKGKKR